MKQNGTIHRIGSAWYGRWREDVLKEGRIISVQRNRKLVDYSDRYRTERDVRPLLDEQIQPLRSGKVDARSTMTLTEFAEQVWILQCKERLAPATCNGYEKHWKTYLKPRLGSMAIRDFKTVTATNFLAELSKAGVGFRTIRFAKAVGSTIFNLAMSQSVNTLEGTNPFTKARLPKRTQRKREMPATSAQEALNMLNAVSDPKARGAIGLTYFGGLSPSEARGALWENYDGNTLRITQSVWRTHAGPTKTESREQPIPVIKPLREILAELREADGNPTSGPILRAVRRTKRDENGDRKPIPAKPLNLDNLARRVIRPALKKAEVKWNGWYANRRGAGTITTALAKDSGLAAKGLLRHANLSTTTQHYVKGVPAETELAMKRVEQLFQGCSKETPMNDESTAQMQ